MKRALAAVCCCLASVAAAQDFPSGTMRFIVSSIPGGPTDALSRGLQPLLSKSLGQAVLVENRIGADGIIGAELCAKAPADGHTICAFSNSALSLNPVIRAKLPYDPLKDFAGVVFAGFFDSVLVVHSSVPADNVSQLLDLARSKPNGLEWGHFGINTTGNFYQEYLKKSRSAPFYPVPYKTTGQVLQALVTGEAKVAVYAWPGLMDHIRAGKLKPLAVTADRRMRNMPNVPTFEEEGIKLPLRGWFGFNVPAGTPRPVVVRLNSEIRKGMADPGYRESILARQGIDPRDGTPEEYDAFVRAQIRDMTELMAFLGIKPH
jgi:tripartite-type tricarboxylate transporter receptor subunit TctC